MTATRLHRKSAIRLLNRTGSIAHKKKPGRPRVYSLEAMTAVKVAGEASARLCSRRFEPFLPELVRILKMIISAAVAQEGRTTGTAEKDRALIT